MIGIQTGRDKGAYAETRSPEQGSRNIAVICANRSHIELDIPQEPQSRGLFAAVGGFHANHMALKTWYCRLA